MVTSRHALERVAEFYEGRLAEFGNSPQGAGWNGGEAQRLRFLQLEKLLPADQRYSLADLGCGQGAFLDFLHERHHDVDYAGCDISPRMIECARSLHAGVSGATFSVGSRPAAEVDYCVASGIFNVPAGAPREAWEDYVDATIEIMHNASRRGFAFNCLTTYSDPERMSSELYYGDPGRYFDLCKRKYARNVALLHDYDLYDFTIVVRKQFPA